jgi:hypothetical protein
METPALNSINFAGGLADAFTASSFRAWLRVLFSQKKHPEM